MTRTDTSNGALTRSAGVCRKRIPKRDSVAASAQIHNASARLAARRAPGLDEVRASGALARRIAPIDLRLVHFERLARLSGTPPVMQSERLHSGA